MRQSSDDQNPINNLEDFELYLIRAGNKPSSIKENLKLIQRLNVENPGFSKKGFDSFVLRLKKAGRINSTINHFIIAIRHWGKCFNIPDLATYPRIKGNNSTFIKSTMSDEEIEAFLSLPYYGPMSISKNGKGYRKDRHEMWTVFFMCLAYTGARPSEIAHLMVNDVDFGLNVLWVDGKTGKRKIPISFVIKQRIQDYIRTLEGQQLFPCYRSKEQFMDGADWRYPFYERLKRLGIKRKNLTVYSLRHSFITRLINENLSLFKVQKIVGHRQITTTEKYVHLSDKVLQEIVESDPLASSHKSGKDHLREILKIARELEEKYSSTVYTAIEMSEDGTELLVRRKVRQ